MQTLIDLTKVNNASHCRVFDETFRLSGDGALWCRGVEWKTGILNTGEVVGLVGGVPFFGIELVEGEVRVGSAVRSEEFSPSGQDTTPTAHPLWRFVWTLPLGDHDLTIKSVIHRCSFVAQEWLMDACGEFDDIEVSYSWSECDISRARYFGADI